MSSNDPIPGVDVVVEKVPPGSAFLVGYNQTKEEIQEEIGVVISKEDFLSSSKKQQRFSGGLESSPKFTRESFDDNLENIAKVINTNAIALADLQKKRTILKENFIPNQSTSETTDEEILHQIVVPAESVSDNGEINLNYFLTTADNAENKTIRIKINNEIIYDSSLAQPRILNPRKAKIMIDFSIVKTSDNSGFLMGKSHIISDISLEGRNENLSRNLEITQPGFGTIENLNWNEDQFIVVTGQNSTSESDQITLVAGKFNIPSPVTEYVRWQYATQNGECVRRKVAYGSEVGGGPIFLTVFEPCP
jgi:hypothetical protein